jgi:hypothetical protein
MSPKCPRISETLIFAGNSRLAAQLSCLFAAPGVYLPFMSAGAGARSNTYNHHGRRPTAETWCGFFLRRGAGLPTCHFLFYRLFSFLECHADKASSGSLEAEQDEAQMPR